jgi:hypothetical protein
MYFNLFHREKGNAFELHVGVLISLRLFSFPIFLFAAQSEEFFLGELKKLQRRNHKCVELRREYVEQIHFFNPAASCFLYKAKDLSVPFVFGRPSD